MENQQSPYWKIGQAAEYLNLSVSALYKKVENKEIFPIRLGSGPRGRMRFTKEICDEHMGVRRIFPED